VLPPPQNPSPPPEPRQVKVRIAKSLRQQGLPGSAAGAPGDQSPGPHVAAFLVWARRVVGSAVLVCLAACFSLATGLPAHAATGAAAAAAAPVNPQALVAEAAAAISAGDTAWVLTSTALVSALPLPSCAAVRPEAQRPPPPFPH
jgi:hypothetical protein